MSSGSTSTPPTSTTCSSTGHVFRAASEPPTVASSRPWWASRGWQHPSSSSCWRRPRSTDQRSSTARLRHQSAELADREREPGEVGLALAGEGAQERVEAAGSRRVVVQEALDGDDRLGATGGLERRLGKLAAGLEGILADGLQRPPLHPRGRAHASELAL